MLQLHDIMKKRPLQIGTPLNRRSTCTYVMTTSMPNNWDLLHQEVPRVCFLLTKCCATTNEEQQRSILENWWNNPCCEISVVVDRCFHASHIEVVLIWPDRIKVVFQSSHGHLYSVWSHLFLDDGGRRLKGGHGEQASSTGKWVVKCAVVCKVFLCYHGCHFTLNTKRNCECAKTTTDGRFVRSSAKLQFQHSWL